MIRFISIGIVLVRDARAHLRHAALLSRSRYYAMGEVDQGRIDSIKNESIAAIAGGWADPVVTVIPPYAASADKVRCHINVNLETLTRHCHSDWAYEIQLLEKEILNQAAIFFHQADNARSWRISVSGIDSDTWKRLREREQADVME